jgi:acyl-CoA thioesterase FadM
MNLYFRLFITFVKAWFAERIPWSGQSSLSFRVWPLDCDAYLHLTASRYLGIADLGRIHFLGRMGIFRAVLKRRWFPVAQAIDVTYIRSIQPFQKFRLRTRLLTWDDKYWYAEHRFEVREELRAVLIIRGVFVRGRTIIPMPDVMALTGGNPAPPSVSNTVQQWRQLLKIKKDEYS